MPEEAKGHQLAGTLPAVPVSETVLSLGATSRGGLGGSMELKDLPTLPSQFTGK